MPITIATTYVFIYKIIPEYLITKRYFLFSLYSIYAVVISTYLIVVSVFFGLIYLSNLQYSNMAPISKSLLFVAIAVYMVVLVVSAFKLLKINLVQAEETKQLSAKILETQLKLKEQELQYLKMQIHPHFLFNTLNTLYGFALKKADEAPEMILKLSNLLDYLLYKVDKPFVLLEDDVEHIKDYIELEKMRFNDTLQIDFSIKNISENFKIAPMLLIPFVENSFKHGAIVEGYLSIKIKLKCEGQNMLFSIENTNVENPNASKGIGLENIKKRLDLLYFEKYTLDIQNRNDIFKVSLQLNLD
jgi:LytS/YehU family sensor histidine kinase